MPICSNHKVQIRQSLETALHDSPAKGFLFKSTSAASPTTFFFNLCMVQNNTADTCICADRCCGLGCMHWQQLCVEMTIGVNSAREQWPESAGLSPKNTLAKCNIPTCMSASHLNSCICTQRFVEINFETVTINEDYYFTDTDSPKQESLIIDKLSANQK